MPTRTPMRVLLTIALTLALLPMFSTFAPGGQVAGFTTASPAVADQIWYQSVGRASETAACEKSTTTELAAGWTQWAPSWAKWVNGSTGGFVCNRQITWAFDSVPPSSSGSGTTPISRSCTTTSGGSTPIACAVSTTGTRVFGPGGGIVFSDAGPGQPWGRYLEAAPSGWFGTLGVTADPGLAWAPVIPGGLHCRNLNITGDFGTAIGTGPANTTAITAVCTAAQAPAAWAARNYTGGGLAVGSWFLPSKDELNQLFLQRAVVGGFDIASYWSSSQIDADNALIQGFSSGTPSPQGKNRGFRVRPVRAF
jgi:hypothetical protein